MNQEVKAGLCRETGAYYAGEAKQSTEYYADSHLAKTRQRMQDLQNEISSVSDNELPVGLNAVISRVNRGYTLVFERDPDWHPTEPEKTEIEKFTEEFWKKYMGKDLHIEDDFLPPVLSAIVWRLQNGFILKWVKGEEAEKASKV